jgi:hypothetical protein
VRRAVGAVGREREERHGRERDGGGHPAPAQGRLADRLGGALGFRGGAQKPSPRLGPGRLRLGGREQATDEVAIDLSELVAVESGLGIAFRGGFGPTRQRPQHREHRGPGHQREKEPDPHGR